MNPEQTYELLRLITSPVVAITSRRGDKLNGMISDGVVRASIVPDIPRMIVLVHKISLSHTIISATGRFCLHILHEGQFAVIEKLGFVSGRDKDKLGDIPHTIGKLGLPVLDDHVAAFECEVLNMMDTGSSTMFLGEAKAVYQGPGKRPMTPTYMREHMPPAWRETYVKNLAWAQSWARERSYDFTRPTFPEA